MIEVFWTIASLVTLVTGAITIIARVSRGKWGRKMAENGQAVLEPMDRLAIQRLSRLLEEETRELKKFNEANKRGTKS